MTQEAWFVRSGGGGGSFGGSNSLKAYFGDEGPLCPLVGTIWSYSILVVLNKLFKREHENYLFLRHYLVCRQKFKRIYLSKRVF